MDLCKPVYCLDFVLESVLSGKFVSMYVQTSQKSNVRVAESTLFELVIFYLCNKSLWFHEDNFSSIHGR